MMNTTRNLAMLIAAGTAEVLLEALMVALVPIEWIAEKVFVTWDRVHSKHQRLLEELNL
jgi:hypothetical protein